MKKFILKLIIICLFFYPAALLAQAQPDSFTLIIIGTKHYADVDIIKKNIQKMSAVKNLQPSMSSQKHLEFSGTYGGDKDALVADIESLASDRYTTQSKNDKNHGLIITLRKISEK